MKTLTIIILLLLTVSFAHAGQAVLTWEAPTTNEDGTPLTDLAGYKIYYGKTSGNYTEVKDVGNVSSYTVNVLTGTWYFVCTAYNTSGMESMYSNEVMKDVKGKPSSPKGCSVK